MTFFPLANSFSFSGRFKLTLTVVVVTEELLVMTKEQLCNSGHSISKGRGGRLVWLQWLQFLGCGFLIFLVLINYYFRACDILEVFFGWSRTKFGDFVGFWLLGFTGFWIFWSGFFDILWPWSYFNWGEVKYWRNVWVIVVKFRLVLRVFYWWWGRWGRLSLKSERLVVLTWTMIKTSILMLLSLKLLGFLT